MKLHHHLQLRNKFEHDWKGIAPSFESSSETQVTLENHIEISKLHHHLQLLNKFEHDWKGIASFFESSHDIQVT